MSVRKIISLALSLVLSVSLVACSSSNEPQEPIKILSPTGAPALSLLSLYENENVEIETVEGTDVLTAELSKKDSEYDIIVAPTNLGAKLYSQAEAFNLEAVLTWGNLYLVGPEGSDLTSASIAAFGEKAVPQLVFQYVMDTANMNVTYYASVQEAQQALLTGQTEVALLAQPVAAATIAKAKEQGKELLVLEDLQALWKEKTGSDEDGYPQASLFVRADANVDYALDLLQDTELSEDEMKEIIDKVGVDKLGVPNAEIAVNTYSKQNIRYEAASDVKDQIEEFLNLFNIELPEGLIK